MAELLQHEAQSRQPHGTDNSESPEWQARSRDHNGRRDRRAAYALTLQKACNDALQRVKSNNMLTASNWASPLAAAPCAVSIMAICLKTAAEKRAAGLEIGDINIKNEKGDVVGTLPSTCFHTNLQHCSDIGRLAFLEAQKRMNSLRSTAQSMIEEEGSIGYIIDLLEDSEDARYNLKPEVDRVRAMASDCLKNAKAITDKFEYWHLVICHLKQTSLTQRGETIKKKDDTESRKYDANANTHRYSNEKAAAEAEIQNAQTLLATAQQDVAKAQAEVEKLQALPPIAEPSDWEDAQMAREHIPDTEAPKAEKGIFPKIHTYLFGQSKADFEKDMDAEKAHYAEQERRRSEHIARAKERREYQRELACDRLNAAQETERRLAEAAATAREKLSASDCCLTEAKTNLSKTATELQRLGKQELELENIMEILDQSTHQLGMLKEQIEPLVLFFDNILVEIDKTVEKDVESFLRPITNGIRFGANPDEAGAIELGRTSKKRILATALQIQGRFSAIADISEAYVKISDKYIRLAINKMESLATVGDSDWHLQSQKFSEWCDNAVNEIGSTAQRTNDKMERNMVDQINTLQKRAIEAASEHDD